MKRGCLSVLAIARASIPVRIASLNASFYAVAALTLQSLVLFASTDALCQSVRSGIGTIDLEQQLDIPLNNGIQGEDRDQADFLLRLGGQALGNGNYDKAIANWWQALDLYQRVGDLQAVGLTYDYLGVTYAKLGRYQQAEDALRRRLGIARTRQDFLGQIYGLNNLGTALLQSGNFRGARESFTEAVKIARSIENEPGEGLSLSNLGLAAAGEGKYLEAIKQYKTALSLRSFSGDPLGEANTRNNLADAYRAVNLQQEALISYQTGLSLAQVSRDVPNQFRGLRGLAQSYTALKNYNAALKVLEQSLNLAQQQKNHREELLSLRLAAGIYQVTGNLSNARSLYEEAITLAGTLGDIEQEAFLRNDLAQIIYYQRLK